MSDCITDDSVAEIYVEIHKSYGGVEQQDGPCRYPMTGVLPLAVSRQGFCSYP